ncbi:MAG: YIP1 family protein [Acidobacteriota bacterium]
MAEDNFAPPPPPPDDAFAQAPPPPPGPPYGGPTRPPIPWEQRDQLGFFPALIETVKLFVTSPREAYERTPASTGDYVGPILYAVILAVIGGIFGFVYSTVLNTAMTLPFGGDANSALASGAGGFLGLILTPIFAVIGLFIGAGLLHLALQVVGGLGESEAGFEGSVRTVAFASTAQLAQIVPIIGGIGAAIWALVFYVFGLAILHRTTEQKAILAVVLLVTVCCVCIVGTVLIFGASIAGLAAAAGGGG